MLSFIMMNYVYKGKKINLKCGYLKSPDGQLVFREVVEHPGSVVILPITNNNIILLKQYRYALNNWIYELPAGTISGEESPEACARRELLEETGYKANKLIKLFEMYISPGYSTEYMYSYLALDLTYEGIKLEEGEVIQVIKKPLREVIKLIECNVINDAKSIATILYFLTYKDKFSYS